MKTAGEISQKLKQIQFRHAKKEISRLLSKKPENCQYNRTLVMPGFGSVGFCSCEQSSTKGTACDSRFMSGSLACPVFENKYTEDSAREAMKNFFRVADPQEIAARYPDVTALQWAASGEEITPPSDPCLISVVGDSRLWAESAEEALRVRMKIEQDQLEQERLSHEVSLLRSRCSELLDEVSSMHLQRITHKKNPIVGFLRAATLLLAAVASRLRG